MKDVLERIKWYLEQFCRAKETGKITFEVIIGQGGVRNSKVTVEKNL